jgi:hypothetical protein
MPTEPSRSDADRAFSNFPTACFSVHADVDPGLMPRIVAIFARRGLVPSRLHSSVGGPDERLTIDLELHDLAPDLAVRIAAEMRAVWGVSLVLSSNKHPA